VFRDLSRPIETGMPTYPGDPEVSLASDATHEADGYATGELRTGTHAGTHVDAPRHTLPDGAAIDGVDPGRFAFDARLVDCRPLEPREAIGAGRLPEQTGLDAAVDFLVFRTGWAAHWGTDSYRDHPYLTEAAAARCRDLGVGVGLDAFGPDPTPTAAGTDVAAASDEPEGTPSPDVLLKSGLPIVENLCGLDGLPERFRLYAFPLRLRGGDGSPVRAVAEWEG
jgi:kynurenine formamidase